MPVRSNRGLDLSSCHTFSGFSQPSKLIAGWLTLFAVGAVLGELKVRTRSLWLPIGVHAGWILGLKTLKLATRKENPPDLFYQIGDAPGGILALGAVITTWFILRRLNSGDRPTEVS